MIYVLLEPNYNSELRIKDTGAGRISCKKMILMIVSSSAQGEYCNVINIKIYSRHRNSDWDWKSEWDNCFPNTAVARILMFTTVYCGKKFKPYTWWALNNFHSLIFILIFLLFNLPSSVWKVKIRQS